MHRFLFCPRCGTRDISGGQRCRRCYQEFTGLFMPGAQSSVCGPCMTENPAGGVFCVGCGGRLEEQSSSILPPTSGPVEGLHMGRDPGLRSASVGPNLGERDATPVVASGGIGVGPLLLIGAVCVFILLALVLALWVGAPPDAPTPMIRVASTPPIPPVATVAETVAPRLIAAPSQASTARTNATPGVVIGEVRSSRPGPVGEPVPAVDAYIKGLTTFDATMMWFTLSDDAIASMRGRGGSLEALQAGLDDAKRRGATYEDIIQIGSYALRDGRKYLFFVLSRRGFGQGGDQLEQVYFVFTVNRDGKITRIE